MRIAHVTDCYLPQLGGIEIQVHDLAMQQILAGHDALVLTCEAPGQPGSGGGDRPPAGPSQASGVAAVPVIRTARSIASVPTPATRWRLRRTLRTSGFDAIHVHSSVVSPFAWNVARQATSLGIPTVVTMHSMAPSGQALLKLSDRLVGWSRWPVAWTAVSEAAAAPLRRVLDSSTVTVLPNGIDPLAWYKPLPRRPAEPLTIVSVLRLSRRKRPAALLRTLTGIRAAIDPSVPLRAVLIGEGPQRRHLERYLRSTGMDSWVTLTGRLTRAQIRPLLWDADVYLAPAELESFGIAALEARCAGLPVIAMAAGGVGEFIRNGQSGFLVHSDEQMIQVTARLLTSPDLRVIQEHNRASMPSMTWPRVVGLSLDLYRQAGARLPVTARASDRIGV